MRAIRLEQEDKVELDKQLKHEFSFFSLLFFILSFVIVAGYIIVKLYPIDFLLFFVFVFILVILYSYYVKKKYIQFYQSIKNGMKEIEVDTVHSLYVDVRRVPAQFRNQGHVIKLYRVVLTNGSKFEVEEQMYEKLKIGDTIQLHYLVPGKRFIRISKVD